MVSLYRHYDYNSKLLYVGISLNALNRLNQHENNSEWYYQISRVEIEHYATLADALKAEKAAITNELPIYNTTHNKNRARKVTKISPEIAEAYIAKFPLVANGRTEIIGLYKNRWSVKWIADHFGTEPIVILYIIRGINQKHGPIINTAAPAFEYDEREELSLYNLPESWLIPTKLAPGNYIPAIVALI